MRSNKPESKIHFCLLKNNNKDLLPL